MKEPNTLSSIKKIFRTILLNYHLMVYCCYINALNKHKDSFALRFNTKLTTAERWKKIYKKEQPDGKQSHEPDN